ncbi:hypothetical protein GJ744_008513 [Endocarpon pusillum]|uniref:Uncharacterized protein n=1 Tax=Endocarpon pusillum TaxID=364733 RepID=A0A8H7AL42_9EURO|nr:hypothetical protein GJ744_008513 [Endocarpon pusillum]
MLSGASSDSSPSHSDLCNSPHMISYDPCNVLHNRTLRNGGSEISYVDIAPGWSKSHRLHTLELQE